MTGAAISNREDLSTNHSLFIVPTRRDGFMASIRGRAIELEDPTDDPFAPTPDELLILSIASDSAWHARRFLRDNGLAADVNVTVTWRTLADPPRLADVSLTVDVPAVSETTGEALLSALEERAAVRSLDDPPHIHLSCER